MIYPIQNHKCTEKCRIETTNDGNKTQKCTTCGWTWKADDTFWHRIARFLKLK